jgi:hypothetical protein
MNNRRLRLAAALAAIVVLTLGIGGSALARGSVGATDPAVPASPAANETLIFSYAAKFVCQGVRWRRCPSAAASSSGSPPTYWSITPTVSL